MDRKQYLVWLAICIVVFAGVSVGISAVMDHQFFTLYGYAIAALVALPLLAATLRNRTKALGFRHLPNILLISMIGLAACLQIGFWLAFLNGGEQTLILGYARQTLSGAIGDYFPIALGSFCILGLWIIGRLAK